MPNDGTDGSGPTSITLPTYFSRPQGLPPADAPLRESIAALRSAAANGNATAACRLAFTAMDCWDHAWLRGNVEAAAAIVEEEYGAGNNHVTGMAARRIEQAPPALRRYVEERVHAIEMARATAGDGFRTREQRCEGAPALSSNEVATLLRQAALQGQPAAVVAYTHAEWMNRLVGRNAARTPEEASPPMALLRDPAFQQWRREAVAIHQAGLEAGLLPVIESEAVPNRMGWLDQLVARDPVQQAAAIRALALILGSGAPPGTSTLGLDPARAVEADRLSERWAAAAAGRAASWDPERIPSQTMVALNASSDCE